MTTTIQQLGRQAALMEKVSSTALVRMIQKGLLSSKSINRAARYMKPGQFRRIKHLGAGAFNSADLIVGNVGSHAGIGVRKIPTYRFANPKQNYRGVQAEVDRVNKLLPTESGVPAIAPYYHVGDRGAFQHFAGSLGSFPAPNINRPGPWDILQNNFARGSAQPLPPTLHRILSRGGRQAHPDATKYLTDLHLGNVGPGGQILDFMSKQRPAIGTTFHYPKAQMIGKTQTTDTARLLGVGDSTARWLKGSLHGVPARVGKNKPSNSLGDIVTGFKNNWNSDQQRVALHKWYDGMSQAQRARSPLYTPPLRPIREGIADAWGASPVGVRGDAIGGKIRTLAKKPQQLLQPFARYARSGRVRDAAGLSAATALGHQAVKYMGRSSTQDAPQASGSHWKSIAQ